MRRQRVVPALLGLLGLASAAQGATPVGNAVAGKAAFKPCASCHAIGPGARQGFGPQLNGVIGRVAGSAPGYAYSPAMKQAGFVWTEQRLADYLRDSEAVVPGNRMRFAAWGYDDQKIADLLAYLRSASAGG